MRLVLKGCAKWRPYEFMRTLADGEVVEQNCYILRKP